MLDLLLFQVVFAVRFDGHAVIAHAFGSMPAHLLVFLAMDLAILLIQPVVQRHLLDGFPGVLDEARCAV